VGAAPCYNNHSRFHAPRNQLGAVPASTIVDLTTGAADEHAASAQLQRRRRAPAIVEIIGHH